MKSLDQILDELAVPGVEREGVADYVVGGLVSRRRHRRLAAVTAAALVVLGAATALAITNGSTPDEVVAHRNATPTDRHRTADVNESTTTAPGAAATTAPTSVPTTVPMRLPAVSTPVMPLTRLPVPAAGSSAVPPATTVPLTTTADQPLQASVVVATPAVAVGDVVRVTVNWSDPDLPADAQPLASFDYGDPTVGTAGATSAAAACTGGGARSGTIDGWGRYTTAGVRTITVAVSSCGRIINLTATITVAEPKFNGQAGRSVVVRVGAGTIDPEGAALAWVPEGGQPVSLPERQPGMALRSGPEQYASTVVVLPVGGKGVVRLSVPGSCTLEGAVDLGPVPADQQAVVTLPGSCP